MTAAEQLKPRLRDVIKDDWAFILSSWKKSHRDAEPWVPSHIYFAKMHVDIERLKSSGATFRIACDPDDANFIWGWACYDASTLHYVYVRTSSRDQGVATLLVRESGLRTPISCSHWSTWAAAVAKKHPGALVYSPVRKK